MKHNDHDCHGGPHDGCKVTHGSGMPDMPESVNLRQLPNEDGFQPWSREPSDKFPAIYKRQEGQWGHYYFSHWHDS